MSYKELKSYQQAALVYDFTVAFCDRYVEDRAEGANKTYKYYSRMSDQMIQAARSGKQNIVEGSSERTSEKSELKLLGVARASFQELLEDYEDFLRQRCLRQWGKDDTEARAVRGLYKTDRTDRSDRSDRSDMTYRSDNSDRTYMTYQSYLSDPKTAANVAICLIHQTNFLLDRQIHAAEQQFVREGGYGEKLRGKREEEKKRKVATFLRNRFR